VVNLNGFGGDFETNDGRKTTLKILVDESKAGVVLFTYPKARPPAVSLLCALDGQLSMTAIWFNQTLPASCLTSQTLTYPRYKTSLPIS
jgi:peroxiredoxin